MTIEIGDGSDCVVTREELLDLGAAAVDRLRPRYVTAAGEAYGPLAEALDDLGLLAIGGAK